jgi:methylated-DNA-[protein]-cysteine S-methyltransferase
MDEMDDRLRQYFSPATVSAPPLKRLVRLATEGWDVDRLVGDLGISATARGVRLIRMAPVAAPEGAPARRIADLARREIAEYLEGNRTFFSVPVDLADVGAFQAKVLAEAARIPYGEVISYAGLADRIGYPRAARAVGNALGANPVPVILPCHRIIRGDGTWGHYLFGPAVKTRLLALERSTPALVGSSATRVVCRHGCPQGGRTREDRRVVFASVEDAWSVGYRSCPVCRP